MRPTATCMRVRGALCACLHVCLQCWMCVSCGLFVHPAWRADVRGVGAVLLGLCQEVLVWGNCACATGSRHGTQVWPVKGASAAVWNCGCALHRIACGLVLPVCMRCWC